MTKENGFPIEDSVGTWFIETTLYGKNFIPQIKEERESIGYTNVFTLQDEIKYKKLKGTISITGITVEFYKTRKSAIIGHKRCIRLLKLGLGPLDIIK